MKNSITEKLLYISIFWGLFWLDKFSQKQYKLWIVKLFTFWWYGIWWIIDILIIYKELNKEDWFNIPKVKLSKWYLKIIVKILKIIGYGILAFIILGISLALLDPDLEVSENKIIENKIEEVKVVEKELTTIEKQKIYYIYWQSEHITWWLTVEKYWDTVDQNERDEFFKKTREEFEIKLTEEKEIDYELYKKHAIDLWYWEWSDNNWDKPNSDSSDVLVHVYSKEKYENYIENIKIDNAFKEIKNSDNLWMQCWLYITWNGYLSRFNYAKIKKLSNNNVDVYTIYNWINSYWNKTQQSIVCKYKYNDKFWKYEIFDVEL